MRNLVVSQCLIEWNWRKSLSGFFLNVWYVREGRNEILRVLSRLGIVCIRSIIVRPGEVFFRYTFYSIWSRAPTKCWKISAGVSQLRTFVLIFGSISCCFTRNMWNFRFYFYSSVLSIENKQGEKKLLSLDAIYYVENWNTFGVIEQVLLFISYISTFGVSR